MQPDRNSTQAGAYIPTTTPCVIPTLFMNWEVRGEDAIQIVQTGQEESEKASHKHSFCLSPAACTRLKTPTPHISAQVLNCAESFNFELPSDFTSPPTHSTVVAQQTNWYLDRNRHKNVVKLKNPNNIQTSEYCTPGCGGLSNQVPPHELQG